MSGGEIAALTVIDSVSRMIDGVVGKKESVEKDTFQNSLLKNAVYTRPAVFKRKKVPKILISGNHTRIKKFNRDLSLIETLKKREDLLEDAHLDITERAKKLKKAEIILLNDMPFAPIFFGISRWLVKENIVGWQTNYAAYHPTRFLRPEEIN